MGVYSPIIPIKEEGSTEKNVVDKKLLSSKIEGVNLYLQTLIQKKIRLDLEIKRTKKRLSKLKRTGSLQVKLTASAESDSSLDPEIKSYILEGINLIEDKDELQRIEEALQVSEAVLEQIETLPLYDQNK